MKEKLSMNPWLNIWIHPRKTIREIVDINPKFRFIILSFIYGFPGIFHIAQALLLGRYYSLIVIIFAALVLAIPFGYILLSFTSLVMLWMGKIIKGKGKYYSLRAAVSWSNVPNSVNVFLWIVTLFVIGKYAFSPMQEAGNSLGYMIPYLQGVFIVQFAISIWSFVIFLHAVGEVQGFSAWMAFLNAILAFILVSIVFYVVLLLLSISMGWAT